MTVLIKDRFRMQVVVDPLTNAPIAGATFTVYDMADTGLTVPLTVLDMTDVPMTLTSGPLGIVPDFQVVGHTQVNVVSADGTKTPLDSMLSFLLSVWPDASSLPDGLVAMVSNGAWIAGMVAGDGSVIPAAAGQPDGTALEVFSGAWALGAQKAPLNSPAFTGNPTAPTPTAGDNDTSIATTAFVAAAVAALVASSPATLDTLKELADALGDDPNFATTIATALGLKAPLASPALTGNPTAPTQTAGDSSTKLATTAFVQAAAAAAGSVPSPTSGRILRSAPDTSVPNASGALTIHAIVVHDNITVDAFVTQATATSAWGGDVGIYPSKSDGTPDFSAGPLRSATASHSSSVYQETAFSALNLSRGVYWMAFRGNANNPTLLAYGSTNGLMDRLSYTPAALRMGMYCYYDASVASLPSGSFTPTPASVGSSVSAVAVGLRVA